MSVDGEADPLDVAALQALRRKLSGVPRARLSELIASDSRRSPIAVLRRYVMARRGPGGISAGEYLKYGLQHVDDDALLRFAGVDAVKRMHAACNDRTWFAVTKHKLLFENVMHGAGIAAPRSLAIWDRKGRAAGARLLSDETALSEFLSKAGHFPLFAKPVTGVNSLGVLRLDAGGKDNVLVDGRRTVSTADLARFMSAMSAKGYLFQKLLEPDREFAAAVGADALISLRFLILYGEDGPRIEACVVKLPGTDQVADNFWRPGAALCGVDLETGTITGGVYSRINEWPVAAEKAASGRAIRGLPIPGFAEARELAERAGNVLPGIRTQSWDIALTEQGPLALEVNFGGDLSLIQLGHGRGVLTPGYCEHLRRCGYGGVLPC